MQSDFQVAKQELIFTVRRNQMVKKGLKVFVLSMSVVILSGYTFASPENLFKNGTLKIDKITEGRVRITSVSASVDKDSLKLSGKVKKSGTGYVKSGHIDLAIISPDGELLKAISTYYVPKSLNLKKRHTHGSTFHAELSFVPPEGSIVRIAFHRTSIEKETFTCSENIALLKG